VHDDGLHFIRTQVLKDVAVYARNNLEPHAEPNIIRTHLRITADPMHRKPIGMSTADGEVGFRVEFDARNGARINGWSGKEKGPHFGFKGNQSTVNKIRRASGC
jgi:hypothetical protein